MCRAYCESEKRFIIIYNVLHILSFLQVDIIFLNDIGYV